MEEDLASQMARAQLRADGAKSMSPAGRAQLAREKELHTAASSSSESLGKLASGARTEAKKTTVLLLITAAGLLVSIAALIVAIWK